MSKPLPCTCGRTDGYHFPTCKALAFIVVLESKQIKSMHWVYREKSNEQ